MDDPGRFDPEGQLGLLTICGPPATALASSSDKGRIVGDADAVGATAPRSAEVTKMSCKSFDAKLFILKLL